MAQASQIFVSISFDHSRFYEELMAKRRATWHPLQGRKGLDIR